MSLFGMPEARYRISATDSSGPAIKSAKAGLAGLGGTIKGLGGAVTGLLGIGGLGALSIKAINFGSALTDVSAQLGINVEALQVLQEATTRAGVSNEILERGLRNIKSRIQDAADGQATYADALDRLGLSTRDLIGLPLERQLEQIANAYGKATDKSAAFLDVQSIIGDRAGPKLIEVLDRIAKEGYNSIEQAARDAGQVMDEEIARALDDAADKIEAFKKRTTIATGKGIAPFLETNTMEGPLGAPVVGSLIGGGTRLLASAVDYFSDDYHGARKKTDAFFSGRMDFSGDVQRGREDFERRRLVAEEKQAEVLGQMLAELVDFNTLGP